MQQLCVGSTVYQYCIPDWFNEGRVILIDGDVVHVDMLDWIQGWHVSDLHATMVNFKAVFVPDAPGWLIRDFGQGGRPS